jgi:hypothetical protein
MPLVALYTAAFNVLLWLSRCVFASSFHGWGRWALVLLAPSALFAAALRALPSRRAPLAVVTCISITLLGMLG